MKDLAKYYEENLYPLQDGVLSIVKKSGTPFFLTGGTALSRFYTHHRYSDDLDLFVINDPKYSDHVDTLLKLLVNAKSESSINLKLVNISRSKDYTRLFIIESGNTDVELRIDLINDVAAQYGDIKKDPILGRIDSIRNILSNKLTALFRNEPKDVADIHVISKQFRFNWKEIVLEAKSKEVGVEPDVIHGLLMSFPIAYLDDIKWIEEPDKKDFQRGIKIISEDILFGRDNSLFERGS